MTNEVKNVPELRFPGFEDEWKLAHLNDLGDFTSGGTPLKTKKSYWNGDIPWLTTGDINGKEIYKASNYIAQEGLENSSAKLIYKKAILIAMYGQGKTRGMSSILNFEAATNQACAIFQTNNDIKFMHQFFRKDYNKLRSLSNDGSQKNLSLTLLKSYQISVPKLEEQKKIGDFFSKLDRQIELEEQKLEKLEEQKKGYMQQIFSQKFRFKDENGNAFEEWKNTNFNYFMSESDNLEKGIDLRKDQLLTVKLQGNGVSKANINRALKMGSTVYYKRFAGQFIYGKQNFFNGAFGIVPKSLNNFYSSGDVPALNIDYSKIYSDYFINYISREDYYKKKEAFSTGTGSKRIHEKTLLGFDIMLPSIEEQKKIGDFFNKLDDFIENQSDKVELLKRRKQGFLQKMFV